MAGLQKDYISKQRTAWNKPAPNSE